MNFAIILSGGTGTRLGASIPKQYLKSEAGKQIIEFATEPFAYHDAIDGLVFVVADDWKDNIISLFQNKIKNCNKLMLTCQPGETRQYSIYNALLAIERYVSEQEATVENIIIHDAARPLVSESLISRCLDTCDTHDGAMPVIPVKDTVYQSRDGKVIHSLLDRSTLFCGQAPEAFRFQPYLEAHKSMSRTDLLKINGSSELAHLAGMEIALVEGDPMNFKITDISDLNRFNNLSK